MAELAALTTLPLRARCLADAVGAGSHRSRRRGASVEFSNYRSYNVGDDLRRVDWRLLARTDRLQIRETHEEAPLRVMLLLDISSSMNYASRPGSLTKLDYARALLGAIALIARRQRDACGIGLLGEDLVAFHPPSTSPAQFQTNWATLETPTLARQTPLAAMLERTLNVVPRSCLFILASDFYEDPATLGGVLQRLRFEGHDALGLHVIDPAEADFPFTQSGEFVDPETGEQLPLDAAAVAPAYREAFAQHGRLLQDGFTERGLAFHPLRTDTAPLTGLGAYLARRAGVA
jgi:uncharacterized protein (DUF58 family)